ncbi:MAG TPA: energy transducer TonB [Gemmatimonadaceae bacterium]|nr:energy transducer TonB [Gemmatimonadaceae bacterium]
MSRPLRVWRDSYAVRGSYGGSAGLSLAAHALVVLASVVATRDAPERVREQLVEMIARYHVPEDRVAAQQGRQERISWVQLGVGTGTGPLVDLPTGQSTGGRDGGFELGLELGNDEITLGRLPTVLGADSAYTVVEVDSTVQRDPFSAAPAYPPELLAKGVQGVAMVRYVVDTTGRADMRTFQVLSSTHELFSLAVREALPQMRFTPAKIGQHAVRQLVEQPFQFRIQPSVAQVGRRDAQGAKTATP